MPVMKERRRIESDGASEIWNGGVVLWQQQRGRKERGGGTDQRIAERQKRREAGDTQDIIWSATCRSIWLNVFGLRRERLGNRLECNAIRWFHSFHSFPFRRPRDSAVAAVVVESIAPRVLANYISAQLSVRGSSLSLSLSLTVERAKARPIILHSVQSHHARWGALFPSSSSSSIIPSSIVYLSIYTYRISSFLF